MGYNIYNEANIASFKQEIGYDQILRRIDQSEVVVIDWPSVLARIQLMDGTVWKGDFSAGALDGAFHARISGDLQDGEQLIELHVHVLSGAEKTAIDFALETAATTMMAEIPYDKFSGGPGDLYLKGKEPGGDQICIMSYKNVVIVMSSLTGDDVAPLAAHLQSVMAGKLMKKEHVPALAPRVTVSEQVIVEEAPFSIEVSLDAPAGEWSVELLKRQLPPGIEYLGRTDYRFEFRAVETGDVVFRFGALNRETLMSTVKNVKLSIGN